MHRVSSYLNACVLALRLIKVDIWFSRK